MRYTFNRALLFLFFSILTLPTSGLCAHTSQPYTPIEKQTLRYSHIQLEPFLSLTNQTPNGLIVDYLQLLETKLPIKFVYQYTPGHWSMVRQKFDEQAFDVLPTYMSMENNTSYEMSKPLFYFNLVLAGRKTNSYMTDLNEVVKKNLRVAVIKDSSTQKYLKITYPNIQFVSVNTIQEGLMNVEHQKVDLFVGMAPSVGFALQNSGLTNIKIIGILKDQIKLVLASHDEALVPLLNQGIDAISQDEKDALFKKYIKIEMQEKVDYTLISKLAIFGFFIIIGFAIWLAILKREIHKRKQVEEKLIVVNRCLEHSTEELKMAMVKTAHAYQAKNQFLANMSHEIRTPMNTIIGMTELLLRRNLPEKEHQCLSKVAEASHHLLDIINDILDFSKIEANKIQLESIPFHLEELIRSISDLFSMKAQQKGLELLIDMGNVTSYHYKGDPLRLKQILLNLLSNAIKFTTQGEVIIRLYAQKQYDGSIKMRFEVKDTGIGITEVQQHKLFTAFSQADMSSTRHYEGTGLGLSIAQGLVMLMKGEIFCQSVYGKGSTFWFEIPLSVDTTLSTQASTLINTSFMVLVVDDNETALEILTESLQQLGAHCVTCKSASEVLERLEKGLKADVALIDWKMEGMDGVALFERIQEHYADQIPAMMMVTAYDKEELMEKLGEDRFHAKVLIKPITTSMLFDALAPLSHTTPAPKVPTDRMKNHEVLHGMTVLLAEDNESNQMVACEILAEVGMCVHVTKDGQEVLTWLQTHPKPDLILMDCQMPVLDGYATTRHIRDVLGLSLPIIAMTANTMSGDEELCYAAGMNSYIAKPIDAHLLIEKIAYFFE